MLRLMHFFVLTNQFVLTKTHTSVRLLGARADQDLTLQCVLVGGSHLLGIIGVCAVFGLTWFKDRRVHTIWRGGDSGAVSYTHLTLPTTERV